MLVKTNYNISLSKIQEALTQLPSIDFRLAINKPTGDFFYDDWAIKEEFKGSVWEEIYNSIPALDKGEARIINLEGGSCYASHADMDDRYHLNLSGDKCYLINLNSNVMHPIVCDGSWYEMDAGINHTAVNLGYQNRYQLVIRKLLVHGDIQDPISVKIKPKEFIDADSARFIFDDVISPWLNVANKGKILNNFKFINNEVSFDIDKHSLESLKKVLPEVFEMTL